MSYQATMKDVAEAAGVSVGTVSNVLKGDRRVSLSMVQRVQAAIRRTGYRAYVPARNNNKIRKTRHVGVVLPSAQDPNFAGIFTGANQVLAENAYQASLHITAEIQAREQSAIEQLVKDRVEGLILVTCQPESADMFQSIFDNGTQLVFVEREPLGQGFPLVKYDSAGQMRRLVGQLLAEGFTAPLLVTGPRENSSEAEYITGFALALSEAGHADLRQQWLVETNFNKESAFSSMVARLTGGECPDIVITTSLPLLAGAQQAVAMLGPGREPEFVSLADDSWAPTMRNGSRYLRRDPLELGGMAARLFLDLANDDDGGRNRSRVLAASRFKPKTREEVRASVRLRNQKKTLRGLMLAGSASQAVESMLPAFERRTGLRVELDRRPMAEIGRLMHDAEARADYDIFQIDQPWLGEAAADGLLYCLDDWLAARSGLAESWLPGVLDAYCRYEGRYFSVPFLFGAQILFYRRDLFDDPDLRAAFRKQHRYDLRSPKNWREFNQIAAFFTRALNPASPVEFGTALGGQDPNGAVCDFLPRLFAFREDAADPDKLLSALATPEAVAALENYVESYRYAPPGSENFWWDDEADIFDQGKTAMTILFLGHASPLADRSKSRVVGKIGYDLIPGGRPMLGGWTLGVNNHSRCRDEALEFLGWTCEKDLAVPFTILGGAPPATRVYRSPELCSLYPWLPKAEESFHKSYWRNISKITTHGKVEEKEFERILGGAVHQAATGELAAADALALARAMLLERLK